jgi:transcriptional regulator with XRE-family HTH domain
VSDKDNQHGNTRRGKRFRKTLADFSNRLTQLIADQRIVQKELADYLGYSAGQINHWKSGEQMPKADDLVGISEYVGKPVSFLLGLDGQDERLAPTFEFESLADYLWNENKTEEVEKRASVIWVATPDFFWMYEDTKWRDIVFNNITKRGTKHYFLYKDSDENRPRVKHLTNRLQSKMGDNWRNLAHYVAASTEEFPGWAEYVLYDPFGEDPHCIMVLGVDYGGFRDKQSIPNLAFTWPMRDVFTRWFQAVWNKRVEDESWKIGPSR